MFSSFPFLGGDDDKEKDDGNHDDGDHLVARANMM